MSHTRAMADTYYHAYGEAKSLVGYGTVGRILDIPLTKKRQRFSAQQTEAIKHSYESTFTIFLILHHYGGENMLSVSLKGLGGIFARCS